MSLEVRLQMSEQMDKMTKLHINVERKAHDTRKITKDGIARNHHKISTSLKRPKLVLPHSLL